MNVIRDSVQCRMFALSKPVSSAVAAAVSHCGEMNLNLLTNSVHTNNGVNVIRFSIDFI